MSDKQLHKAIEYLESLLETVQDPEIRTIIPLVVKDLQRHIPQKVKEVTMEYDGDYGKCPRCEKIVSDYDSVRKCKHCDQKLIWK